MQDDRPDQGQNGENGAPPDLSGISLDAKPLARGPAGTVYKGWDRVHRVPVVVKTLRGARGQVAADRFRREAAVMARLRHPNIVALYRFEDGDPSALVMEYVPGRTLAELVAADGPLSPARTAGIVEGIAAALDRIHLEGIVHRDVKPSNILLPPRGPAKLTDFGVARADDRDTPLTVVGDILGTIEYTSPEQVHGETAPDARSDVYSLAAVTYFALAGVPPFPTADNSTQAQLSVMHRQVFSDPPPMLRAGLPPEVEAAVLRGLAKAPAARPASAGQFAAGLRSAVEAGLGAPEGLAAAASTRRTAGLAGAAAGAVLLMLGGVAAWRSEHAAPSGGPAPHSGPAPRPPRVAAAPAKPVPKVAAGPAEKPGPTPAEKPAPAPVKVAVAASLQELHRAPRLSQKAPVTERPRFRRHPGVLARAAAPVAPRLAARPMPRAVQAPAPAEASLSVFATQNGRAVPARTVTVDGRAMPALAAGGLVALPAGRHFVAYAPDAASGFAPNPGLWVTLAPGARVARQILLPAAPKPLALVAAAPKPPPAIAASAAPPPALVAAAPALGFYTVSGWAAAPGGGARPALVRAPARSVTVDGQPRPELIAGDWATLPAGRHTITFQPALGLGAGPKTWDIDLAAKAYLQQQIPLPPAAPAPVGYYTVTSWVARTGRAAAEPALVRASAQWVKVDGQPVLGLALGQWATLPAGRHTVTLQPAPGLGLPAKTWDIDLAAQDHLDQKIPLPAAK